MKLTKKKNGKGYLSGFLTSISLSEAREAGFLDSDNNPLELEKRVIDGRMIIQPVGYEESMTDIQIIESDEQFENIMKQSTSFLFHRMTEEQREELNRGGSLHWFEGSCSRIICMMDDEEEED